MKNLFLSASAMATVQLLLVTASPSYASASRNTVATTADLRQSAERLVVTTPPPGGWRVAETSQKAGSPSSQPETSGEAVSIPQATGSFPENETTTLPVIVTKGGDVAFKKDVAALQRTLTELQQLSLQLKQAHWNVSGTLYYPLHLLLQEHYEGVSKLADTISERMLSIGSSSDGRATTIIKTSGLPEIPGGFLDDAQVLSWFTMAYKKVGDEVKVAITDTNDIDPSTSNLLQEVEHQIAKYQWQFRAEFQRTATNKNDGSDINDNKPIQLPQGMSTPAPRQGK